MKSYFWEATKRRAINSPVVKELRWLIPSATGFAFFFPDAAVVAPSVALGLAVTDRFVVSQFNKGWRPAIFVDTKLRSLINK